MQARQGPVLITRMAGWFLLAASTFGLIIPVGSFMLGYRFLPSQDYVEASWPIACLVAVCSTICVGYVMWSLSAVQGVGKFKRFEQAVLLIVGGWVGWNAISTGLPFARALMISETSSIHYQVGRGLNVNCHESITFKGLPVFFNSLCGVEEEFRFTIGNGDVLLVEGEGTPWGIFPTSVSRKVPNQAPPDADRYLELHIDS